MVKLELGSFIQVLELGWKLTFSFKKVLELKGIKQWVPFPVVI
jgi:hypothetical protein